MAELYGRAMSRRETSRHAGMLSQFAGVRLMTLGDGVERGVRMLEFRTGTGFRFTGALPSAGIRRRDSGTRRCTSTKVRAAWRS
jgi:hypothetical protein